MSNSLASGRRSATGTTRGEHCQLRWAVRQRAARLRLGAARGSHSTAAHRSMTGRVPSWALHPVMSLETSVIATRKVLKGETRRLRGYVARGA